MDWLCNLFGNTTFLTVIAGTLVFVIGQIFIEFILKPIQKYKKLKADAAFCLRFYRNKFKNCIVDEAAQMAVAELAAEFIAYSQEKPSWLFKLRKKDLLECCEHLTLLSYCVSGEKDYKKAIISEQAIVKVLDLYGF